MLTQSGLDDEASCSLGCSPGVSLIVVEFVSVQLVYLLLQKCLKYKSLFCFRWNKVFFFWQLHTFIDSLSGFSIYVISVPCCRTRIMSFVSCRDLQNVHPWVLCKCVLALFFSVRDWDGRGDCLWSRSPLYRIIWYSLRVYGIPFWNAEECAKHKPFKQHFSVKFSLSWKFS